MTLYYEPEVKWAGSEVGGIRISHVTDISEPIMRMLSVSRGKRKVFTLKPLEVKKPEAKPVSERVAAAVKAYNEANDAERISKLDAHIDALFAECDDTQKAAISQAREAAVERGNQ